MAAFLLLWFLTVLTGYGVAAAIWPGERSWRAFLLRLALSIGLGIAIASGLYFLMRAVGSDPPAWVYLSILALLATALLLAGAWRAGWKVLPARPQMPPGRQGLWLIPLGLAFVLATNSLIGSVIDNPEGAWDAWAMWNLHARFLFQPGAAWQGMFDPALVANTHPDYPLLTPAMIALGWRTLGRVSTLAPLSVALVFTLATSGLVFAALNYQRKFVAACLAAMMILLSTPILATAAILYADIPLAYGILAAVVCLTLYTKEGNPAWLVLGGAFCGITAWTKNEGWSVLAATTLVLLGILWAGRKRQKLGYANGPQDGHLSPARAALLFLAGVLPWALLTAFYKLAFTPANDLFAARTSTEMLADLLSVERWQMILETATEGLSQFDGRIFFLLALFILLVGLVKESKVVLGAGWLVLALLFLQYLGIFAITPHDLDWHLAVMPRLITQLYPAALFLVFNALDIE